MFNSKLFVKLQRVKFRLSKTKKSIEKNRDKVEKRQYLNEQNLELKMLLVRKWLEIDWKKTGRSMTKCKKFQFHKWAGKMQEEKCERGMVR